MRPLAVAAAVAASLVAAVFGFGHVIGAWEAPAVAEPAATAGPVASSQDEAPELKKQKRRERAGRSRGDPRQSTLPAAVVERLDELCRRARVDAEHLAGGARPTSKKKLRWFFARLGRLSRGYNAEALEALGPHADDPRARALARLFGREERLFGRLLSAMTSLDSAAGRARFEQRLAELRDVGLDEARVLVDLGAPLCDATLAL